MKFQYGRFGLEGAEKLLERGLELFPGVLSWLIIIGMVALSLTKPLAAAIVIIAFLLFWLLRMTQMNILLVISYIRFAIERDTDWLKRVEEIDGLDYSRQSRAAESEKRDVRSKISQYLHYRQVEKLRRSAQKAPASRDIYHVVILPVVKEGEQIVRPGIESIKNGAYPSKKILIIITVEQRAEEKIKKQMLDIRNKFKEYFWDFLVIEHPTDLPGESRVKGANVTFAGRRAAEFLAREKIPFENVIVSCFDADSVAVPNYFSCLTYYFMVNPRRQRTSFQPVPVYFNNIWGAPAFARVVDVGTSFFQLIESTDSTKLITFSSHSMNFKALDEIGYWPTDIISDDSAIFWKAFLHYGGDYQAIPMPIAISMDIATGSNVKETFWNIYRQKRRWAWGVENFPIVIRGFIHSKEIPVYKKLIQSFRLIDKFTAWATWPILLGFITFLPLLAVPDKFAQTTVFYIKPRIQSIIFALSMLGIVVCIITSWLLLPAEKTKSPVLKRLLRAVEWLMIPVVFLLFSAFPALDAQTRLMLGKYLEFRVSDKGGSKK